MKKLLKKINLVWVMVFSTPLFLAALFIFRYTPTTQFEIFSLAATTYLIVALIHHYRDKTLTLEIIIEYFLIAALALLILQGLIL